jgi:hypothetical protein
MLELFDLPAMNPNCLDRNESIVAPQALHMMNDATVRELAGRFAARVRREAGSEPRRQIDRAYRIAFARPPTDAERELAFEFLGGVAGVKGLGASSSDDAQPLTTLCHALLKSAEFLYID